MGYVTRAFLGAYESAEVLHNPCTLGGPKQRGTKCEKVADTPLPSWGATRGQKCYITGVVLGAQTKKNKIKISCPTPAFSGAHKWAEMQHNPCNLRCPQTERVKIRVGYLTPAFLGPTSGRGCYIVVL